MCHADLDRSAVHKRSIDASVFTPRIGNYRLPVGHVSMVDKCSFLSFMFQAFGMEAMEQRSWYINHIWRTKDASVLWKHMGLAENDENVTDKTFDVLWNATVVLVDEYTDSEEEFFFA